MSSQDHNRTIEKLGRLLVAALMLTCTMSTRSALAGPQGESVVVGSATFDRSTPDLTLIETPDRSVIINYQSFDILSEETVRFIQPDAGSRVLNEILSAAPTSIDGNLLANGQVYIVNPAGVVFGHGAVVDVAKLFAAGGTIDHDEFLLNVDRFTDLTGAVKNEGAIDAAAVHLIGRMIENAGTIVASDGLVVMAAGQNVLIGSPSSGVFVSVGGRGEGPSTEPAILNSGRIDAGAQGAVSLVAGDIYSLAFRQAETGSVSAADIRIEGGDGGAVEVAGSLDASNLSEGGKGGSITVLGDKVGLFGDARLDASGDGGGGTVLVGGNFQGKGPERNADLTFVGPEASIAADAITFGDGGEVIVWADGATNFHGSISARGGEDGGEGGFVESSGREYLSVTGARVDTSAPAGEFGIWLLDPTDIRVVADGTEDSTDLTDVDNFADADLDQANNETAIAVSAVDGALATVVLQATNDIFFDVPVNVASSGVGITAQAGNDITVDASLTTNDGNITFSANNPGGTQTGTGAINVNAAIDGGGGTISMTTNGGTGAINLAANVSSSGGGAGIIFSSNVALTSSPITIDAGNNFVRFDGLVDGDGVGARALVVNAAGSSTTRFNAAVGSVTPLLSLTTNAGGTVRISAPISTSGGMTFQGPVVVVTDNTLTDTGGVGVTFGSTVNGQSTGGQALTLDVAGTTTFSGVVGGSTSLASITTNAAGTTAINGGSITTTGSQTYNDAVNLAAGTQTLTASALSFASTLDGPGALDADVAGATTFSGIVGGTTSLAAVDTDAAGTTAINGGSITTAGSQTYNDAVSLAAGTQTLGASALSFGSMLDGPGGLDADVAGATTFSGIVGGTTSLAAVDTDAAGTTAINGGSITTAGSQTYNDAVSLAAGTQTLGASVLSFGSTLDGPGALDADVAGATTFGGIVGGTTSLASIDTDAAGTTAINGGSVTTTGSQTYNDAASLGAGTQTLTASSLSFGSTLDGPGGLDADVAGATTFGGIVGGTTSLASIDTDAAGTTAVNGGSVTTTGSQTYNDAASLGAGTQTLTASALSFGSTLDGPGGLDADVAGATTFSGSVGGTTSLASIDTEPRGRPRSTADRSPRPARRRTTMQSIWRRGRRRWGHRR